MKFLNLDRVLCLSAHPDDTEYGILGSMMKFQDTQFDIVVLSNGGDFDESSGFNRERECTEIWNELSNVDGIFAHKTYVKDTSEDDWVNYIEQSYNIGAGMVKSDYDCILSLPAVEGINIFVVPPDTECLKNSVVPFVSCNIIPGFVPDTCIVGVH